MLIAFALAFLHDTIANFHNVPNEAVGGFADGDDIDLPVFLD